uniref:Copia protein n=1 Tax=Tanacetum cinerariifolium TaxID=118510 RepID=A0A6L2LAK3_TANCI|nr:copia protein [Tanacetum cinerariifolium]
MKMENYLCHTDYLIGQVIQNGNGPASVTTDTNGMIKVLPPKTAEEVVARENERKARTTLLMALPKDHLAKFHQMADAKEMWEANKSRFGGNDKSKKMQKYLLKQQFKGFSVSASEGLHKGYDRVFERNVKGTTASSSFNIQNVAFMSADNTSSTNDLAMISMRIKKFHKRTGKKLQFDTRDTVDFDKTKVECFNCHKIGHFARDCRAKWNQESRRRDGGYNENKARDNSRRPASHDDSKALVTIDGEAIDWTRHVEKDTQNFAMMAYSSSNSECDLENTTVNDRYAKGMHAVPPPITGNYMPSRPNVEIDYSQFTYGTKQTLANESDSKPIEFVSSDSDHSVETTTSMPAPVDKVPKIISKPKVWTDAPIIEEYELDSDDDSVSNVQENIEKPSFAFTDYVRHVKSPRENVKETDIPNHYPKIKKQDRHSHTRKGLGYARKSCFVFGSFSHLIRDCDFHEKRMAKQVALTKSKEKGTKLTLQIIKNLRVALLPLEFPGENQVPFKIPRQRNMYSFNLKNIDPSGDLSCLFAKASIDESNKWHRRLGHVNFKNLNKLVKGNLVRGLPSKIFENDHTCVACQKGKQHKASCPQEANNSAGTQANDDQGTTLKEIELHDEHFVLPIWSAYSTTIKSSEDKIQNTTDCKLSKKPVSLVKQIYHEGLEKLKRQEKEANDACCWYSRALNDDEPSYLDDPSMPHLEDIYASPSVGIFTDSSYDTEGVVWILVDLPFGKKAIGTKWVYRNKKDERGVVVRNKERLVTKGHRQEEGIDYDECFAPVARIESIRIFLAFASYIGFIVYKIDVKSAFLYDTIDEEVYVTQPPGFVDLKFPNKVYKVSKALCGLHQAPRAWYATFSTFLEKSEYRRGAIDKTLFIKQDKKDIRLTQVYVDDIIFCSTKKFLCDEFEELIKNRLQMSSMGELTFFLGLQVKQKEDGIFISLDKYVAEILKKLDFLSVKTASTPIETQKPLVKDKEADVDVHLYRSMIGSLMYFTASRPDIMFVVCACSRFQVTPKTSHLQDVKSIFRYLKGQPKLGLWYPKVSSFDLEAYSHSEYAGANLDKKSTTGAALVKVRLLEVTTTKQSKELASPKQTTIGKDESNPLIVDSLLKTIWSSMHHVIAMKHWLFQSKRMLRVGAGFSRVITPLFKNMLVPSAEEVDKIEKIEDRVHKLEEENKILKEKAFKSAKVDTVAPVEDKEESFKQERMIADIDEDDEEEHAKVEEVLEVVTTAKLMIEVVTTAKPTTTAAQVPKLSGPMRRRGVVIQDPKETAASEIRPLFEKHYNSIQDFLEKGEEEGTVQEKEIEEEGNKRHGKSLKQELAKKQRMDKEAEELKRHLQIVANDDDDVYTEATPLASKVFVVDYQIHHENNKPYYKIIRADRTHKLFLSFITLLNNFNIKDLETLWNLVKERFETTELKNFSYDFLLNILKIIFEKTNVEANVWKDQKGRYGLAKVKIWKLFESYGVHIITLTTTQMFLLVKKKYPLTHFTLEQMLNNVRLKVEEESEMSLELPRLVRRQLNEGYVPE